MPAKRAREEPRGPPPVTRRQAAAAAPPPPAPPPSTKGGRGAPTALKVEELKSILRRGIERLCIGSNVLRPTDELLGREPQVEQIHHFFTTDTHKTLMLFGMPGTGKTCAVKHAIARAGDAITSIFINGYIVQRPTDVYRSICEHLTRTRLGHEEVLPAEQSASYLEKRFRTQGWTTSSIAGTGGRGSRGGGNVRTCIIVVDELDKCIEKNPKVLYRLVEWLALPHAHCRLVGIANSMEFPMDQKTKSRLDSTNQIVFHPYSEKELMAILEQRLGGVTSGPSSPLQHIPVMSRRAMEYVCKQTASQYGDVRRLLQSTSSAVHGLYCAFEEGEAPVPDVDTALRGLVDFRHVHAVISRVFQERFRDFVMSMKAEILFLTVCVVAVETRQIERQREGDGGGLGGGSSGGGVGGASSSPSIGLDYLYQQCYHVLEAFHDRLGFADARVFSRTVFLKHLTTLKEVGFLEFSLGGGSNSTSDGDGGGAVQRMPVRDVWTCRTSNEPMWITMSQLPEVVLTMCEVHDTLGPAMKAYLSSTTSAS